MFKTLKDLIESNLNKLSSEESYLKKIRMGCTKRILDIDDQAFIDINPDTGLSKSRIVCAAIRNELGEIIVGARHYDKHMHNQIDTYTKLKDNMSMMCICGLANYTHEEVKNYWKSPSPGKRIEQGFVDQHNTFYTREEAWIIASNNDQIIRRIPGCDGTLYSENLY